jgi:hypothetical protein
LAALATPAAAQQPPPEPAPPPEAPPESAPPPEQQPPPQQPPPGYAQPPGYGQPPPPGAYPPNYNYGLPPGTPYGPSELDYEEGQPIPPGYHVDTRIRKGMVIGGAVTLGALWVFSVLVAAIATSIEEEEERFDGTDDDGISPADTAMLFIPVAGPFISIVTYEASTAGAVPLIFDGVGQSAGLVLLIVGLAAQEQVLKRDYGGITLEATPMVGQGYGGMGLTGKF